MSVEPAGRFAAAVQAGYYLAMHVHHLALAERLNMALVTADHHECETRVIS